MGDLIGVAVSGTLYYVPEYEFERVLKVSDSPVIRTKLFAALCRINTLYMIARAGSGHIGSSFSSMEIMSWIQLNEVQGAEKNAEAVFFSSKGHDAPGYYSTLIGTGKLDFDLIHKLRRLDGLPGHPDINTPGIITNTGSLGMGVSKAKGIIFANRFKKTFKPVYVLTGDGELQEGQFWESLVSASNDRLHELVVVIDHNKLQSDTLVSKVSDLGDLPAKLAAFGFKVFRIDGNDMSALADCISQAKDIKDKPKVIIADTIKGKGVSFMEHTSIDSDIENYKFHSGAPTEDMYIRAVQELIDSANLLLDNSESEKLHLEIVVRPSVTPALNPPKLLVQAYSRSLLAEAGLNKNLVALDADLILDTGLIPFQKQFPERFIECGIAEQDMVSRAGTLALNGLLPVVHSFSCFLTTRPVEQIYNNSTELSKIIYVGSLAGVVPAGPGHSHQSVHDVSIMGSMANMQCIEPVSETQVQQTFSWAVSKGNKHSVYIRLASVPVESTEIINDLTLPPKGEGSLVKEGADAIVFVTSAVLTIEIIKAAELLKEKGIAVSVAVMPWLNALSANWVVSALGIHSQVFIVENHDKANAFGTFLMAQLCLNGLSENRKFHHFGIDGVPACGRIDEVLAFHHLDATSLAENISNLINA